LFVIFRVRFAGKENPNLKKREKECRKTRQILTIKKRAKLKIKAIRLLKQNRKGGAADYEKFGLACRGEEFGVFGISAFLFGGAENRKISVK